MSVFDLMMMRNKESSSEKYKIDFDVPIVDAESSSYYYSLPGTHVQVWLNEPYGEELINVSLSKEDNNYEHYYEDEHEYENDTIEDVPTEDNIILSAVVDANSKIYYDVTLYGYKHYTGNAIINKNKVFSFHPKMSHIQFNGLQKYDLDLYIDEFEINKYFDNNIIEMDIVENSVVYWHSRSQMDIGFDDKFVAQGNMIIDVFPQKCSLNIITNNPNSIVTVNNLDINNTLIGGNTVFEVHENSPIDYTINTEGYLLKTDSLMISENTILNIELEPIDVKWNMEYPFTDNNILGYVNQIRNNSNVSNHWDIINDVEAISEIQNFSNKTNYTTNFNFTTPNDNTKYILTSKGYTTTYSYFNPTSLYLGTQVYYPSVDNMKNGTTDGYGQYLIKCSDDTNKSVSVNLLPDTLYYLSFNHYNNWTVYDNNDQHQLIVKNIKLESVNTEVLCFTSNQNNSSLGYSINGNLSNIDLKYSRDKESWIPWDGSSLSFDNSEKIYVKGYNPNGLSTSYSDYLQFTMSGSMSVKGNINSLINDGIGVLLEIPNNYCFANLFENCTSLVEGPDTLPATILKQNCYYRMFIGCTSLIKAPKLPATTMAQECYQGMFIDCTSLVKAPDLPALNLAEGCYSEMFEYCSSLVEAPKLPALSLQDNCYAAMFKVCTSLVNAPELPAVTLANYCYAAMFTGCSSLENITIAYSGNFTDTYFSGWVYDVSAQGNFYYNGSDTTRSENAIPNGWMISSINYSGLCFTSKQNSSTVGYSIYKTLQRTPIIYYSNNGISWSQWDGTDITLNNNEKLYVKGDNPYGISENDAKMYFTMSGTIEGSGNINSLLDNKDGSTIQELPAVNCYRELFSNCSALTKAPRLPATKLTSKCYSYMFNNCTNLTVAPELPALELPDRCYFGMFQKCTSLTQSPNLPATKLNTYCYASMFSNCSNLINAPSLSSTVLATGCYNGMFRGCTSLVTAPILPATRLASECYNLMFQGCSALINAPELPARELTYECYNGMFRECTSLVNAPVLPAKSLADYCYTTMFYNCSSLNNIKIYYTGDIYSEYGVNFSSWVSGVSATGDFYYNGTDTTRGVSAIPEGWTIHTLE